MHVGIRTGIPNRSGSIWTPANLANLVVWFRGDVGISAGDGETVSSWSSKEGSFDLEGAVGTPVYRATAGPNSTPYVEFLAGEYLYQTGLSLAVQDFTIVTVIRPAAVATNGWDWCFGSSAAGADEEIANYTNVADKPGLRVNNGSSALWNEAVDGTSFYSIVYDSTSGDQNVRVNGSTTSSLDDTDVYTLGTLDRLYLNARSNATSATACDIAEFLVYSDQKSAGDIALLESYISDRYGL